jgi:hypothetical protein
MGNAGELADVEERSYGFQGALILREHERRMREPFHHLLVMVFGTHISAHGMTAEVLYV